jgi:hypothetical protein
VVSVPVVANFSISANPASLSMDRARPGWPLSPQR